MSPLAHFGVGLAAKRVAPKAPLGILLVAATLLDIVIFVLMSAGIERAGDRLELNYYPWSHGLFMSIVWSLITGMIAFIFFRDRRTSIYIGLVVFSHWVLDFIAHSQDLPLLFAKSPLVGLGWEYSWSATGAIVMHLPQALIAELGLFAAGLAIYLVTRRRIVIQTRSG